jgi:Tfp pilus assembly protein PilP
MAILTAAATAEAQSPAQEASQPAVQQPAAAGGGAPADPAAPDASQPQGFTYNPEGRRDPFVSLLRRGAELNRDLASARPPGLSGMATNEVVLSGIMASKGGYVAMLRGADKKTYVVRSGDRLYDGTVRSITADTMVILQQVNDPLSLEKQREVRKVLRETEEPN